MLNEEDLGGILINRGMSRLITRFAATPGSALAQDVPSPRLAFL